MATKTAKQKNRIIEAKRNLDRIQQLLAQYGKKSRERPVEATHGKWGHSLSKTAGAWVEPAPG